MDLVRVENLVMHYETREGMVRAVDGVSFRLKESETLGLLGESGCGKSSVASVLLKVLPDNARIVGGQVFFRGNDILALEEEKMRHVRWEGISLVFQAAMNVLNPVYRVGEQILEAMFAHYQELEVEKGRKKVVQLLELVGLDARIIDAYPHQLSGGMRQRVVIAMALACSPAVVVADEPTTALDVIMQDRILRELRKVREELGMSMVYITHDIAVIAEVSDWLAVMYSGKIVEQGPTTGVFDHPHHPYTRGLMLSFPSVHGPRKSLQVIPGEPPSLITPPSGCRFHPRCTRVKHQCRKEEPPLVELADNHHVACYNPW